MRFFHCILLVSAWPCALSTDSESLMQVDVKTHEKNAAETGVFNTLKNKLDEATLGSGNHLAISAMLSLAEEKTDSIPTTADAPAMNTILTQVASLIWDILWVDLILVKNTEYLEMNSYTSSSMVACTEESTYSQQVLQMNTAKQFRTTHNDCRTEEEAKYSYYMGATLGNCSLAIARANTILGGVADRTGTHSLCTVPSACGSNNNACEHQPENDEQALPGTIGEWHAWFTAGKASFGSSEVSSYQHPTTGLPESLQQDCINSKIAYTTQRTSCNTAQSNFEQKWCLFRQGMETMCATRATCSSGVQSAYNSNEASWIAASALRVKQACILEHMLCIILELKGGSTNAVTTCATNGTDTSRCETIWGNTMVSPNSAATCSVNGDTLSPDPFGGTAADPSPGQANWGSSSNSEYAQYGDATTPSFGTVEITPATGISC